MTRREAALILGLRESAAQEKIKEAHRRIIIANHPDAGPSHFARYLTLSSAAFRWEQLHRRQSE